MIIIDNDDGSQTIDNDVDDDDHGLEMLDGDDARRRCNLQFKRKIDNTAN